MVLGGGYAFQAKQPITNPLINLSASHERVIVPDKEYKGVACCSMLTCELGAQL